MRSFWFAIIFMLGGWLAAQEYAVSKIPDSLRTNANAVVRKSAVQIEFTNYNKFKYTQEVAITVLNESGVSNAYRPIFYNKGVKVTKYTAEMRNSSGIVVKKYKSKEARDESVNPQGALFADSRVQYYSIVPLSYPFTMVYTVEFISPNTLHLPSWYPISRYNMSVQESVYELVNRTSIPIRKKESGFDFASVHTSETGNTLQYSVKNVPAIRDETLSPPLDELTPLVRFAPEEFVLEGVRGKFDNWEQFGKWYYDNLLKKKGDLSKADKQTAIDLVEGVSDPVDKIRILYQYLQSKTRYINVSIGIGGWEPFPASYVSNRSYGDCKALSNYMVSLLDAVGIDAFYTIVAGNPTRKENMDKNFASLQGNHVIVNVPVGEETIWLECTSQQTAFNYLGRFTDDRWAVSVGPDGGKVIRTQYFPAEQNIEEVTGTGKVSAEGSMDAEFLITASGLQYDYISFLDFEESKRQKEILQGYFSRVPNFSLKDYEFTNDRDEAVFSMDLKFKSNHYAKPVGNSLALNVIPFGRDESSLKKDNNRLFPFEIRFGYTDKLEFEMDLPPGYGMHSEFPTEEFSSEFGSYSLSVEAIAPQKLKVKRKLQIKDGNYPKEKFNDYVDFRRKVAAYDNTKILLEK